MDFRGCVATSQAFNKDKTLHNDLTACKGMASYRRSISSQMNAT